MIQNKTLDQEILVPILKKFLLDPIHIKLDNFIAKHKKRSEEIKEIKSLRDNLQDFKASNDQVKVIYFGINPETNRFHFLPLNDNFKCTDYKIKGKRPAVKSLGKEDILSEVLSSIPAVYDPYMLAEFQREPREVKKGRKNIECGLVMIADKNRAPQFSPFAILDIRSYEAGKFDCKLGCETAFYLPIIRKTPGKRSKQVLGVLLVCYPCNRTAYPDFPVVVELDEKGNVPISSQKKYEAYIADNSEKVTRFLSDFWRTFVNELEEGINILEVLFYNHLLIYKNYVTAFDNFVVRENHKAIVGRSQYLGKELKLAENEDSDLNKLLLLKSTPLHYLENFFQRNGTGGATFPTVNYVERLKELEPLLQSMGKKDHYVHMFKTFLLGNMLIQTCLPATNKREYYFKLWSDIAFSHDIGYPVEMIEKEVESFFEKYFHRKKIPDMLISRELLWSYGNFLHYRDLLKKSIALLFNSKRTHAEVTIFFDMMDYAFCKSKDHAILSALFTMKCIDENWDNVFCKQYKKVMGGGLKKEDILTSVGVPILLHNFYQWKYFYVIELKELLHQIDKSEKVGKSLLSTCNNLFAHLWDRKQFALKSTNKDELLKELSLYLKGVEKLKVPRINLNPSRNMGESLRFLSFILALSDFLQETGRDSNLIPKGQYVTDFPDKRISDKQITLRTPLVKIIEPIGEDDFTKTVTSVLSEGNIYTDDRNYIVWKDGSELVGPFFFIDDDKEMEEKGKLEKNSQSNFKEKYEERLSKSELAWNKEKDWNEYISPLQYSTAYKVFEFHHKFRDIYSTNEKVVIKWENLFEKTLNKKNGNPVYRQVEINLFKKK